MTTPQDPNQPGSGTPPVPNQLGSGTPPAPNQPGWGAPPAGQPGWGAPPAGQQPGWGQPQPGWGQPQPGWGQPQPGWGAVPPQNRSFASRHGCLLAFLIVLVVVVIGVGACTVWAWPYVQMDMRLLSDIGTDKVSTVEFSNNNGQTTWTIHLQPGYGSSEAVYLACHVVGPDFADSQFKNDEWEIVDSHGTVLATNHTPC